MAASLRLTFFFGGVSGDRFSTHNSLIRQLAKLWLPDPPQEIFTSCTKYPGLDDEVSMRHVEMRCCKDNTTSPGVDPARRAVDTWGADALQN